MAKPIGLWNVHCCGFWRSGALEMHARAVLSLIRRVSASTWPTTQPCSLKGCDGWSRAGLQSSMCVLGCRSLNLVARVLKAKNSAAKCSEPRVRAICTRP